MPLTPFLVQSKTGCLESQAHSRSSKCHCRQTILSGSGHSDKMVPPSGGIRSDLPAVASAKGGSLCSQVQQQTAPVCVPSPGTKSLGSGCSEGVLEGPGSVCLHSVSPMKSD